MRVLRALTIGTAAASAVTGLASVQPGAAAAAPTPITAAAPSHSQVVSLPTGDTVLVSMTADGRPSLLVTPAGRSGIAAQISRTTLGGRTYVIPAEARPYFGSLLDPSLFDVEALADAAAAVDGGTGTTGRAAAPTAVTVTASGVATPKVPGVSIGARRGRTYDGVVVDPAKLRAALVSAAQRGTTAPFPHVTGIRLSAAPAAPVTPQFAQKMLRIHVVGVDGKPVSYATVALFNTDDSRRYSRYVGVSNGYAQFSVPAGNYSAVSEFDVFDDTHLAESRLVTVPDFRVVNDGDQLTIDARTATLAPTVTTPRPATLQQQTVEIDRQSATLGSAGFTWTVTQYPGTTLKVNPTEPAKVGRLYLVTGFKLAANPKTGNPYSYDLHFTDQGGVPAELAKSVTTAELGDVRSTYYSDTARTARKTRIAILPFQAEVGGVPVELTVPATRDEYVYASPDAQWSDTYYASPTDGNLYSGLMFDAQRVYPAGATRSFDWLRGPLTPGVPQQADGTAFTCVACRTATTMTVLLADTTDTTRGHSGYVSPDEAGTAHSHFTLTAPGGQVLASGTNIFQATVAVPTTSAVYRVHLDVDRSGEATTTSTATSTDLTFPSSATDGGSMPDSWTCRLPGTCQVLPLLTSTVALPTTTLDRLPVGTVRVPVTIASYSGATPVAVAGVSFEYSQDGTTWRQATTTKTGTNTFSAAVVNSTTWSGKPVSIRVSASADNGSTLVQTTTAAYYVTAA